MSARTHTPDRKAQARACAPGKAEYFIVYPFLKTREWYLLPQEERQRMMNDHFTIGAQVPVRENQHHPTHSA